jgi:hypothetical protein
MSILVNKLAIVMLEMSRQYSYHIQRTDSEMKYLIQVLLLQVITQSKIRLITNNLVLFKEIVFFNNLIQETAFFDSFIKKITFFDNLNVREKKFSILNLIKNIQEFDLLCRQISSQLCKKLERNFSFILIENEILIKTNYVFVSQ